jgi:hypothetical protein
LYTIYQIKPKRATIYFSSFSEELNTAKEKEKEAGYN